MTLATHGDQKYQNSEKLAETAAWPALSIEHRKFEAGRQATPVPICTELVLLLSGGGMVCRTGNGEVQKSLARPGMSYLVPVGSWIKAPLPILTSIRPRFRSPMPTVWRIRCSSISARRFVT